MANDTRGWIVQRNPSRTYTDDDGNEAFGVEEWAYRRPGDHVMVYSGVSADQEPPSQSVAEHYEASGHERPLPDSVVAASEVATRDAGEAQPQAQPQQAPVQGDVQG